MTDKRIFDRLDDLLAAAFRGKLALSAPRFATEFSLKTWKQTPGGILVTNQTKFTPNLVTDAGLEHLPQGSSATHAYVGAGTADPVVTSTGMQSPVASTTTIITETESAAASAPYYGQWQVVFRYGAGVAQGTIYEQGLGWSNGLLSHAKVLDEFSVPYGQVVASDEFLDQTVRIRLYPPAADITTSIVLKGVTYTVTARAANVTNASQWSPKKLLQNGVGINSNFSSSAVVAYTGAINAAVTGAPSGTSDAATTMTNLPYVANSKVRAIRGYFGLEDGNVAGGIRSMLVYSTLGTIQLQFDPVIPKDAIHILDLNFNMAWDRYGA